MAGTFYPGLPLSDNFDKCSPPPPCFFARMVSPIFVLVSSKVRRDSILSRLWKTAHRLGLHGYLHNPLDPTTLDLRPSTHNPLDPQPPRPTTIPHYLSTKVEKGLI